MNESYITENVANNVIRACYSKSLEFAKPVSHISNKYLNQESSSLNKLLETIHEKVRTHVEAPEPATREESKLEAEIITDTAENQPRHWSFLYELLYDSKALPKEMVDKFNEFFFRYWDINDVQITEEKLEDFIKLTKDVAKIKKTLTVEEQGRFERALEILVVEDHYEFLFIFDADRRINNHENDPDYSYFDGFQLNDLPYYIRDVQELMHYSPEDMA
jgi:hypothetical protein